MARQVSAYAASWRFVSLLCSALEGPAWLRSSVVADANCDAFVTPRQESSLRSLLLLFLGIPIPIIILIALFL
jgi:hypothetical protein